jgi:hypothetical protein
VCLRTQRGRPSCPRRRRGQDGHREHLRQFPVIWKEAEAEDGGRQVEPFPLLTSLTSSRFSVVLLRAGSLSQLRVHAERRRRPVSSCLVATSRRHIASRRVSSPRPQRARSPRCSAHRRRTIKIRVFARVGRRPCGNFVFFARHVLHVDPRQVTSPHAT